MDEEDEDHFFRQPLPVTTSSQSQPRGVALARGQEGVGGQTQAGRGGREQGETPQLERGGGRHGVGTGAGWGGQRREGENPQFDSGGGQHRAVLGAAGGRGGQGSHVGAPQIDSDWSGDKRDEEFGGEQGVTVAGNDQVDENQDSVMDEDEDNFCNPPIPQFTSTPRQSKPDGVHLRTPTQTQTLQDVGQAGANAVAPEWEWYAQERGGGTAQADLRGVLNLAGGVCEQGGDGENPQLDRGGGHQGVDLGASGGSHADGLDLGSTAPQMTGDGHGAPADEAQISQRQDLKEMCLLCKEKIDEKILNHNSTEVLAAEIKVVFRFVNFKFLL